jgi:hypothetical protein
MSLNTSQIFPNLRISGVLPDTLRLDYGEPSSPPRQPYFRPMANAKSPKKLPKAEKSAKPKKLIRETVKYPTIDVTDANNSCLNPSLPFEHVLSCGHLITTAFPNEPCAPNCHHAADEDADLEQSLKYKSAMRMKNGNIVSDKDFYCDACVETELEAKIPAAFSSANAEERRAMLRSAEARTRKKTTKYRKCYIAMKVTSVQCHSDGELSSRYVPREERHPFDTAMPPSGENMFEDVDPEPKEYDDVVVAMKTKKIFVTIDLDVGDWEGPEAGDTIAVERAPREARRYALPTLKKPHSNDSDVALKAVSNEDNDEPTVPSRPKRKRGKRTSRSARATRDQAALKRKSDCMELDNDDETDEEGESSPSGHRLGELIAITARPKTKQSKKRLV